MPRTGTAVAGVAADDRADLADLIAQVVDEQSAWFDHVDVRDSVDGDVNFDASHRASRLGRRDVPLASGRTRAARVSQPRPAQIHKTQYGSSARSAQPPVRRRAWVRGECARR